MTNLNSTLCVQRSIEYALHQLQGNGVVSKLIGKWLPTAACEAQVEHDPERRRMSDGRPEGPEPSKRNQQRRRQLKKGSANGEAAEEEDSSSEFTMHVRDFFGLFVVWCAATFFLLSAHGTFLVWDVYKTRVTSTKRRGFLKSTKPGNLSRRASGDGLPDHLNGDNTNAMLRYLVTEITQLRTAVNVIEANKPGPGRPSEHDTVLASHVQLANFGFESKVNGEPWWDDAGGTTLARAAVGKGRLAVRRC